MSPRYRDDIHGVIKLGPSIPVSAEMLACGLPALPGSWPEDSAPPRVLALDLSLTATGIAEPDGTLSTFKPTTKGDLRLREISNRIRGLLSDLLVDSGVDVDLVVIEDLPMGIRNAAAGALGMLHGAVRSQLIWLEVRYLTVPPASLKTYATGRGNAPKPDMRMALYKRTGLDVPDDNQVDAAWLRYLALDLAGHPELDLPASHRRALDKLKEPA